MTPVYGVPDSIGRMITRLRPPFLTGYPTRSVRVRRTQFPKEVMGTVPSSEGIRPSTGRCSAPSVVTQLRDQLILVQIRVARHAQLFGALLELRHRPSSV